MLKERKMSSNTMRKITRFLTRICAGLCGLILLGVIAYLFLLKPVLVSALELNWDADIQIRKVYLDFRETGNPKLVFRNIQVGNPYGFPRGNLFEIERVNLSLAGMEYAEKTWRPRSMDFFIERINLMRRVSGHLNLEELIQADRKKAKKGFSIAPKITRFYVESVSETSAVTPLLQKSESDLDSREIAIGQKKSFREVMSAFSRELIPAPASAVALPAPKYKSFMETVEGNLQEQSLEAAEEKSQLVSLIKDTSEF